MGCDIHFVVEYRPEAGKPWVGVYSTDYTPRMRITAEADIDLPKALETYHRGPMAKSRHYAFFNALAGVRGDGPQVPKGRPDDESQLSELAIGFWDMDGHSHSWDTLTDFCMKWALVCRDPELQPIAPAYMLGEASMGDIVRVVDYLMGDYLNISEYQLYRVVYWFDN